MKGAIPLIKIRMLLVQNNRPNNYRNDHTGLRLPVIIAAVIISHSTPFDIRIARQF